MRSLQQAVITREIGWQAKRQLDPFHICRYWIALLAGRLATWAYEREHGFVETGLRSVATPAIYVAQTELEEAQVVGRYLSESRVEFIDAMPKDTETEYLWMMKGAHYLNGDGHKSVFGVGPHYFAEIFNAAFFVVARLGSVPRVTAYAASAAILEPHLTISKPIISNSYIFRICCFCLL